MLAGGFVLVVSIREQGQAGLRGESSHIKYYWCCCIIAGVMSSKMWTCPAQAHCMHAYGIVNASRSVIGHNAKARLSPQEMPRIHGSAHLHWRDVRHRKS
jgi:hypothetical protein